MSNKKELFALVNSSFYMVLIGVCELFFDANQFYFENQS